MKHIITPQNNPNEVVMYFGDVPITWDDMSSSTFCSGGSGAGKTTSFLKLAIKSMMRKNIGMVFSTAKTDDAQRYVQYAKEVGRIEDVIMLDASGDFGMNLIEYNLNLTPEGSSRSISFTDLMKIVREIFVTISQQQGEIFWENEQDRLFGHVLVLIDAAEEMLSAHMLLNVITSIPSSPDQLADKHFLSNSKCIQLIDMVLKLRSNDPELLMSIDYFTLEVPNMADRTWASIKSGALGIINRLVRGLFPRILGKDTTNVTPEMTYLDNKIIILNTPPAQYGQTQGTTIQSLFIYSFMQKMLQRRMDENNNYVALVCDEFQTLLTSKFLQFVSMSRSNRIINIFATQSISACRVKIGGMQANDILEAFLGNMRTKVLMAHSEPKSNKYSAELIGQHMAHRKGYHMGAGTGSISANASEFMKYLVEPHEFMVLKNGGIRNNYMCEAYITMTGRQFDGLPYMKVAFDQKAS